MGNKKLDMEKCRVFLLGRYFFFSIEGFFSWVLAKTIWKILKKYTHVQSSFLNRFHITRKTMSRGRGKGLRGKGRVSLFPARPISLSGRHYNEKCLRHFPDYCLAPAEVMLHREIKCHAHLATAKYIAWNRTSLSATQPSTIEAR